MSDINFWKEALYGWFFNPQARFSWFWLLEFCIVATLLGGVSWWPRRHPGRGRQFFADSALSLFNLILTQPLVIWFDSKFIGHFALASAQPSSQQASFWLSVLLPIGFFIAVELPYTLVHLACHKIPWLWRLHRLHHSARSLSPATFGRTHPLELVINITAIAIGGRLYHLLVIATLGYYPDTLSFHGLSWFEIFLYSYEHFRHSELWISFGPLNYFFSSPALHQIHHSVDERHRDKNFSLYLSLWDLALGTLYVPRAREKLTFGLAEERPQSVFLKKNIGQN